MARPNPKRYTRASDAKQEEVKRKIIEAQQKKAEQTRQEREPELSLIHI